jgi:drug/metabolite transporter (DMT)-like permease
MLITLNKKKFMIDQPLLLMMRALMIGIAVFLTYCAYRYLSLPIATSLGMTGPLITTLLSVFFLKEQLSVFKVLALVLGYSGVMVLASPKLEQMNWFVLVALGANFFASCAIVLTKKLLKTNHVAGIIFWVNIIHLIFYGTLSFFFYKPMNIAQYTLLGLIGICSFGSQFCYAKALSHENASFIAPFEYTRFIFTIPLGYFVFGSILENRDFLAIFLIFLSTQILLYHNRKKAMEDGS